MANPIMNEKAASQAAKAGWGAPDPGTAGWAAPVPGATGMSDGPVSAWRPGAMTVAGTATATGVLLVLLLATASVGWLMAPADPSKALGLAIGGLVLGFICAIALRFRPNWARVLAPVYALAEGFFLGVVSRAYDEQYNGIVLQAVGATLAVFTVMLVLYRTRILKVTDRFRRIVMTATMGLMLFYGVSFLIGLFTGFSSIRFLDSASPLGIGFSLIAAGLAAMMLAIDFDLIEKGAQQGWPKGMEWYAAFGLLATLIWLYLEILRLLSKLERR